MFFISLHSAVNRKLKGAAVRGIQPCVTMREVALLYSVLRVVPETDRDATATRRFPRWQPRSGRAVNPVRGLEAPIHRRHRQNRWLLRYRGPPGHEREL